MTAPPTKPQWPQGGPLPQRFSSNYARYRERGGLLDVAEDAIAYAGADKLLDKERFVFLSLAFDQIAREGLAGDIVELGVYQGQTATIMARNASRLGRTAWLMDTFAGFDAKDFTGADAGRAPQFTDTSLAAVRARVGEESTRYIQGFFPDTAAHLPPDGRYCLVHIDVDLYAPILSALTYFYPRMVPGGFMIVHDYGSLAWEGADKAVDVFFADKPECIVQMPDSAGSIVVRRQRPPGGATWLQAKQVVPVGEWRATANGQAASLLGDGWFRPEPWGVWGVGPSHVIGIVPDGPVLAQFELDLDVHAVVQAARPVLLVDVLVNGEPAAQWRFAEGENRGVRTLTVPRPPSVPATIELRPQSVLTPRDLNPASADTRPLGVALHRLRVR